MIHVEENETRDINMLQMDHLESKDRRQLTWGWEKSFKANRQPVPYP